MEEQLLNRKADILLDEQITVEIDIKKRTLLDKILNRPAKKVFLVNRATLATLIFFSKLTLSVSRPEETFHQGIMPLLDSMANDAALTARAIAVLLTDSSHEPSKSLVKFLTENVSVPESKSLVLDLINHSKILDFMSTTILIRKMSLLKTKELIAFEETNERIIGQLLVQQ